MSVPFEINKIEELVDGRIFVEWVTIADDGFRLEEGDYFTPEVGESLEDCLDRCLGDVKVKRAKHNAKPAKKNIKVEPKRKKTTRTISDTAIETLKTVHKERADEIPSS